MKKFLLFLVAAGLSPPASAQDEDAGTSPYVELVDALNPRAYDPESYRNLIETTVKPALRQTPDIIELEDWCPGSLDAMISGAEDLLVQEMIEDERNYIGQLEKLLAEHLTEEEALEAAAFYRGQIGSKLIQLSEDRATLSNTVKEMTADNDFEISREALEKDTNRSAANAYNGLSAEEKFELQFSLNSASWAKKMVVVQPKMFQLRYEIDNASSQIMTPADDAMTAAVDAHVEQCLAEEESPDYKTPDN